MTFAKGSCLPVLLLAVLFSQPKAKERYYIWPIAMGGGTFFFSNFTPDNHPLGYAFSGGMTFSINDSEWDSKQLSDVSFFLDVLFSQRAYEGFPQEVHYDIEVRTIDVSLAAAFKIFYAGALIAFPVNTNLSVKEWPNADFSEFSIYPAFSFMCGVRIKGKSLGTDLRLLLGQGPGQFISSEFASDHWLGQIMLGVMAGF
jgi:hypothetical protein